MTEPITGRQFQESDGVEDWREVGGGAGAGACFKTGSFGKGVAFVDEIGRVADELDHHPDVDLRYATVTVRLTTHEVGGLSERDVQLARRISAIARGLGIVTGPDAAFAGD